MVARRRPSLAALLILWTAATIDSSAFHESLPIRSICPKPTGTTTRGTRQSWRRQWQRAAEWMHRSRNVYSETQ